MKPRQTDLFNDNKRPLSNCCKAPMRVKYSSGGNKIEYCYCSTCRKKLDENGDYIKPIEFHF